MRAAHGLVQHEWNIMVSPMFTDLDTHVDREFDILAEKFVTARAHEIEDPLAVSTILCCEVKKSKSPWVLLKRTIDAFSQCHIDTSPLLFASENSPLTEQDTANALFLSAPWGREPWVGYGVHEAFKPPNMESQSYKALTTACKAARESFLRYVTEHIPSWCSPEQREKRDLNIAFRDFVDGKCEKLPRYEPPLTICVRPVVIVDAPLFSAEILPNSEVEIREIEYGTFLFRFGTHEYRSKRYTVDIVAIKQFGAFLDAVDKCMITGAEALSRSIVRELI